MDKLSVCAASDLLLSLSICFLPSAGAASAAALLEYECNNGTSYAANSTYQSNVRSLLATLAANASRSSSFPPVGFATAVVGASPNTVWGLGLCRGDTNGTDCASCLALAPEIAFGQGDYCMGVKEVSVFYDRCLVHYSFRDFLSSPDNRLVEARDGSPDNVTRDADRFDALVVSLVGALSDWAAFNTTTRYAVGTMVSDQGFTTASKDVVRRITGLVQCTPDQAPGPCRQCLQVLIDEMPAAFNGSVGGHIFRVWCNLRFEVFEFYDDSPMLQLVAPPAAPPPSSSPESRDQTGVVHRQCLNHNLASRLQYEEIRCKFKMSQLEELTCLKLAIHMCSWICEDAPKKKFFHSGLWGSNLQDFIKQAQSKKAFHLVAVKIVIIELKWNAQG